MADNEKLDGEELVPLDDDGNPIPEGEPGSKSNPISWEGLEVSDAGYPTTTKTVKDSYDETIATKEVHGGIKFRIHGGIALDGTEAPYIGLSIDVSPVQFNEYWAFKRKLDTTLKDFQPDRFEVSNIVWFSGGSGQIQSIQMFDALMVLNPDEPNALYFFVDGTWLVSRADFDLRTSPVIREPFWTRLAERNAKIQERIDAAGIKLSLQPWLMEGVDPPQGDKASGNNAICLKSDKIKVNTSQEFDILGRAASDANTGLYWELHPDDDEMIYDNPNVSSHKVRIRLTDKDRDQGLSIGDLERIVYRQDADCMFALLYVSKLIADSGPIPESGYIGGRIKLDDVMAKIGLQPRSTRERETLREKIWDFLTFGAIAQPYGERTGGKYTDPEGKEINTQVSSPIWAFFDIETPVQTSLFGSIPVSVEVVLSRQWTHLITGKAAQYLAGGELLAEIPAAQPSGAWARVIGLALANFWARNPHGGILPTRRELLTRYTPRGNAIPTDILKGDTPGRAVEYWHNALQELVKRGYLAQRGEATLTLKQIKAPLPRYEWQDKWLDGTVDLQQGENMVEAVKARATKNRKPLEGNRRRTRRIKAA